jgi:hypothetical protein
VLLVGEEFNRLFREFASSAFRVETLDRYDVDGEREEFARFLAGGKMPADWEDSPWVRSMTDAGKSLSRVHVLRSPLSDYLRFELGWGYVGNVRAGEDIRILDLADQDVSGLPDHDFWLFDDAKVYRMHYTETGEFLGAEPLDEDELPRYRGYRDITMASSLPYEEYWQERT